MPVMDGLTAIEVTSAPGKCGAGRQRVEIYALTANAMPDHARASQAAGEPMGT